MEIFLRHIAVHMAYLQLSLLQIPAVVIHGDTTRLTEHSRWYTLAHMFGFWDSKRVALHA